MFNRVGLLLTIFFSFSVAAEISVPESIRDQIIADVMTEAGYYDAAEIENRIRLWKLEQPQPRSSGELEETGNCNGSCEQTGGNAAFPKPRNVKLKGKTKDGKFTQNLIIKWKRPESLPEGSNYKLKRYKVILSKDGNTYEKYKVKAEYKNNGKPKKHQKLKLRDLEIGNYEVQVKAVYKETGVTTANKSTSDKSTNESSLWSEKKGGPVIFDDWTVGDLDDNSSLYDCLQDQVNTPVETISDSTLVSEITNIVCFNKGLTNSDVQSLSLFSGLVRLNIGDNTEITDISPLGQLTQLNWLKLNYNSSVDLSIFTDKSLFDSLESLYIGHMGLTQVPEFPASVTYIELARNLISDNAGGYFPDHPMEVLNFSNNFEYYGPDRIGPQGPSSINDQLLINLVNNKVQSKTFKAHHTAITNLANLAGMSGLENLDIVNANLNATQNLMDFSGFCSLKIQSDQVEKIKQKLPVQFLDLSNSPKLRNPKLALPSIEWGGTVHTYQPVTVNLENNTGLNCVAYYGIIDNEDPRLFNMDIVPPFNLGNGTPADIPSCPATDTPPSLIIPDVCMPTSVLNTISVYEDSATSRRFISWEIHENSDYERWGVTHFKISTYTGAQLLNVHYQSSDEPFVFIDSSLVPNKYIIQACTNEVCGYEQESSGPMLQGLTMVENINQHWSTDGSLVSFEFSYPQNIFSDPNGKGAPDYFEIVPAFTQPLGTENTVEIVVVDTINDVRQYESSWHSVQFDPSVFIGNMFEIKACSNDIGCGAAQGVVLNPPSPPLNISALSGLSASVVSGTKIHLSWDFNAIDPELIDYIEIVETQPNLRVGHKVDVTALPPVNTDSKEVIYYTDNIFSELILERSFNGYYNFALRACHRDREEGDTCSEYTYTDAQIERLGSEDNIPNMININEVQRQWWHQQHYWSGAPDELYIEHESIGKYYGIGFTYNVYPNTDRPVDYFYFEQVSGGMNSSCAQKIVHNDNTIEFRLLSSFTVMNDVANGFKTTLNTCRFSNRNSIWKISACFTGIGCGEEIIFNLQTDTVETLDINNNESSLATETEVPESDTLNSGPSVLPPGHYWDHNQAGTGWQFHWATHLDGSDLNPGDHGVTYDLVAYWFAYSREILNDDQPGVGSIYTWTPTWYKAKLKQTNQPSVYQGSLYKVEKIGSGTSTVYNEILVGTLLANLHNSKMNLELNFNGLAFPTFLDSTDFDIPCEVNNQGEIDGKCSFTLEDFNILGVDGGQPGNSEVPRFGYGNDDDHYSGVWGVNWSIEKRNAETTLITTISRGLEVTWIATFDDADNNVSQPIWGVTQSCDGQTCNRSGENYFSGFLGDDGFGSNIQNIAVIKRGFNPLKFTPDNFLNDTNINYAGKLGRCFKQNNDFDEGGIYLDLNITTEEVNLRDATVSHGTFPGFNIDGNSCDSVPGLAPIKKIAGNHYIGFEINEENRVYNDSNPELATCNPNGGLGTCYITFDWFTNNDYPEIEAYYSKNHGPDLPFSTAEFCSNTDENPSANPGTSVKGFLCEIVSTNQNGDVYSFKLKKPRYIGSDMETIAKSETLLIKSCANGSSQCESNFEATPPSVIEQDPIVIESNMESLISHEADEGPVPGSGGVSGGAATYHLPIVIPPGVNGMTPDVSINYSSKGGNGIMGVGWSVSAGSSISRCPATLAQDGYSKSVTFDDSQTGDRLCLDGQKLKQIKTNKEYWEQDSEYRTEQDSFNKIVYDKAQETFTVYSKSGRIKIYRQDGQADQMDWLIRSEVDSYGNTIAYSYVTEGSNENLLSKIIYKGSGNVSNNREIEFGYEPRENDYSVSYHHGYKSEQTQRLAKVSTKVNGIVSRSYEMDYRNSHANSDTLLLSIDEVVGGNRRTLFTADWTDDSWTVDVANQVSYENIRESINDYFDDNGTINRPKNISNLKTTLDFNGDGIKELTYGPENLNQFQDAGLVFLDKNGNVVKVLKGFGAKDINRFGPGDINSDGINDLVAYTQGQNPSLKFYQWKIGSDISNPNKKLFTDYFTNHSLSLDFSPAMIRTVWQVSNPACSNNQYQYNFDSDAAEFFIRDYDNDGLDDIIALVQLKPPSNTINCSNFDRYAVKSKLLVYKNNSTWSQTSENNPVNFNPVFSSPEVVLSELEPKFEREDELGGWELYLYDKIEGIEDFNGDGFYDVEVKRLLKMRWQGSQVPMIARITNHHVYFKPSLSGDAVKRSFNQLGLINFQCRKTGTSDLVDCDSTQENTGFGPNAYTFQDVNGDGLKDLLYYDQAMVSYDPVDGSTRVYDRDIYRNWKVRLNKGGDFNAAIFEDVSIESAYVATGVEEDNFLPQGDICENLDASDKRMLRVCNLVFRTATKFDDLNADGVSEMLFPNPDDVVFNRCMILGGPVTRLYEDGGLETPICEISEALFEDHDNTGINNDPVAKQAMCEEISNFNALLALENSPTIADVDNQVGAFIVGNENHFFGSGGSSCLNGSCNLPPSDPSDPNIPFNDPQNTTDAVQGLAYGCTERVYEVAVDENGDPILDEDNNPILNVVKLGLYEDAGGLNALWDRGVYGYSSLEFRLTSDGSLLVNKTENTGLYSPLFWGSGGDSSGDGISDFYAPMGCMDEPGGYELLGCLDEESYWNDSTATITADDLGIASKDEFKRYGHNILMFRDNVEMPNMIRKITVPNTGKWFEWSYLPLNDESRDGEVPLYTLPERDCTAQSASCDGYLDQVSSAGKYFYFNSSMYVVSKMQSGSGVFSDNNQEIISSQLFAYKEAVYNNKGRGFQGFREISVINQPNIYSLKNTTESRSVFHQIFPLAGKLERVETYHYSDEQLSQSTDYQWYGESSNENLSNYKYQGVHFYPMKNATTKVYNDSGDVYVENFEANQASYCAGLTSAFDNYGNNLCHFNSQKDTVSVLDTTQVSQNLITTTTQTTLSEYYTAETGVLAGDDPWWIDKLKSTTVTQTISETGNYTKPDNYTANELNSVTYNKLIWDNAEVRQLDCQYAGAISLDNINDCDVETSRTDVLRTDFDYDGYGNVSVVSSTGNKGLATDNTQSTRTVNTSFTSSEGYFPNIINNQGLSTNQSFDNETGQVTTKTDSNGITTEFTYDDFGFQIAQKSGLGSGLNMDQLHPAVYTSLQSCLNTICDENTSVCEDETTLVCDDENTLVKNLMTAINTKVSSLTNDYTNYNGQFFEDGEVYAPRLVYKTQTRQLGSPVVTQWYDQNNQVVLTRTQLSSLSNSSQYNYTLSLTNHLGQTEIVTEAFQLDGNMQIPGSRTYPYFVLNLYDQKGRLTDKHQEVGELTAATGECWRDTAYTFDGGRTTIDASFSGDGCQSEDVISQLGQMSRSYDSAGKLRQTIDAYDQITEYWYDATGNPYQLIDSGNNSITTEFDDLGRKTKVIDPNMGTKSFTYNAFGEVVKEQSAVQAADGLATYLTYDELGRVTHRYSSVNSSLNPTDDQLAYHDQFDYCPSQNLVCAQYRYNNDSLDGYATSFGVAPVHAVDYDYDGFSRISTEDVLISSELAGYSSVSFGTDYHYYDDYNWPKQVIYRGGKGIGYSVVSQYNIFGQLISQRENTGQSTWDEMTKELIRFDSWDYRGQLLSQVLNNNTNMATTYSYYPGSGQTHSISNNSLWETQNFTYSYDPWGNLTGQSLSNGSGGASETLAYDQLQRLDWSQVDNEDLIDYDYDVLGNLTLKTDFTSEQVYGAGAGPNAITSSKLINENEDIKSYQYDVSGNRIRDLLNGYEIANYSYDAFNMLTDSRLDGGAEQVAFNYDANNNRYLRAENSDDPDGGNTLEVTFYGSPAHEMIVNDATGEVEAKFHIGGYLTVSRKDNLYLERHFLQKDRLGSTTQILNESGEIIQSKGYDAFGKPRNGDDWSALLPPVLDFENTEIPKDGSLTTDITKRGFTDHEHLDAFELIHMNGRMYDYNNGRFLSVDPFIQGTDSQAINPYSYIGNNPLSGTDPTGYLDDRPCNDRPDKYACQWDQSIANVLGIPRWMVTQMYNGMAAEKANKEKDDGDNSEKESQSTWWSKAKKWWNAPGPATQMQNESHSQYIAVRKSLQKAYENGEINAAELEIYKARLDIEYATIKRLPSNRGETYLLAGEAVLQLFGMKVGLKSGGPKVKAVDDVWTLPPTERGQLIESRLATTEYKDWFNVGNTQNGYFELVDFQKGNTLVSLKSVDTGGSRWLNDMRNHIKDLGAGRGFVDGRSANMVLDLRVQPGGASQARQLIEYGVENNVSVIVKEF